MIISVPRFAILSALRKGDYYFNEEINAEGKIQFTLIVNETPIAESVRNEGFGSLIDEISMQEIIECDKEKLIMKKFISELFHSEDGKIYI
ncbi:hypothetical protein OR1_03647 [Geobacter sp. OR-1]|uniref:hypothetical protein n=1 Tax=Geobacter sp. OR-1 TaxID=1266765 RepID=UPI00054266F8|nr:hypothetical protein [Geobacter sp. OR-1]GAM11334.1 hypothetical protein OR1_03647 [Geobacter sp. OR-1]